MADTGAGTAGSLIPSASGDSTVQANSDVVSQPLSSNLPEFAEYVPELLRPAWESVSQYPLVGALVVAALFYIAAFLIRGAVVRSVGRLAASTKTDLDDAVLKALKKPIFNSVVLFGLVLATKVARLPAGTDLIVNTLLSLIIVILMRAAFAMSGALLDALGRNHHRFSLVEERTVPLFDLITKLIIILLGSYCLLMIWGINPVGWLASAGIVGIAVGFAAKDTLANLFSGFFILADAPYKHGDYINLDSGERGRVTHIGMRSTRLLTRDDIEITVPNAVIANAKIINESGGPWEKMRVRIAVGAAYGSDVHAVTALLEKIAADNEDVCTHPAPRVRMRAFGESSLDFELLAWIERPEDRGRISHELTMQVYDGFNAGGIEIPYAKRDLYIKEMPTSS